MPPKVLVSTSVTSPVRPVRETACQISIAPLRPTVIATLFFGLNLTRKILRQMPSDFCSTFAGATLGPLFDEPYPDDFSAACGSIRFANQGKRRRCSRFKRCYPVPSRQLESLLTEVWDLKPQME